MKWEKNLHRNEAQLAAHPPHTRQGIEKFHNVMECDYKGVIYCKKQIGPSGNGGLFLLPISRALKLRAAGTFGAKGIFYITKRW